MVIFRNFLFATPTREYFSRFNSLDDIARNYTDHANRMFSQELVSQPFICYADDYVKHSEDVDYEEPLTGNLKGFELYEFHRAPIKSIGSINHSGVRLSNSFIVKPHGHELFLPGIEGLILEGKDASELNRIVQDIIAQYDPDWRQGYSFLSDKYFEELTKDVDLIDNGRVDIGRRGRVANSKAIIDSVRNYEDIKDEIFPIYCPY